MADLGPKRVSERSLGLAHLCVGVEQDGSGVAGTEVPTHSPPRGAAQGLWEGGLGDTFSLCLGEAPSLVRDTSFD